MSNFDFEFGPNPRQNHHQVEINHLRQKYVIFTKAQNQNKTKSKRVFKVFLRTSYDWLQKCWNYVNPKFIRGNSAEFEAFKKLWLQHYDEAVHALIQREPLEKILMFQFSDSILMLGVCYVSKNFVKIKEIIEKIIDESKESQIKTMIFPIGIDGQFFKQEFQSKLQYKRDSVLIIHKNIFNQLVVLDQISTEQSFRLRGLMKTLKKQEQIQLDVKNSIDQCKQNITVEAWSSTTIAIKLKPSSDQKYQPNVKSPF